MEFVKGNTVVLKLNVDSNPLKAAKELSVITPDTYDIRLNGETLKKDVPLKLGGVYTVVGSIIGNERNVNIITVANPNSMHILWLVPQIVIITISEVMFSVTGLEFAFTQAPPTMKSLLQAAWLMTVALGNLIVVIIANIAIFDRQVRKKQIFIK